MRSFQDDIRKTLIQYALVPVAVIALLGALLGAWGWQHDVMQRSEETRTEAAGILNKLIGDYSSRIEYVAENTDYANIGDPAQQQKLYEWLYSEVNITNETTGFFFVNKDGKVLLGNRPSLPEYLQGVSANWGIWQRMQNEVNSTVLEFSPRASKGNSDLLIARAVAKGEGEEIVGYWIFVINGDYIANEIHSLYLDFAVVNRFDYATIVTNPMFQDGAFKTLPKEFSRKSNVVASFDNESFYVTNQQLECGKFYIYSILSVRDVQGTYKQAAIILVWVLLIMIPILLYRVREESQKRSKAADDLIEAFTALKKGNLDRRLYLEDSDFQVVAEAYNRMVSSLHDLMEQNEAKAKANVVSEIKRLESQFHPHFIFNTLENIKGTVKQNPDAAVQMIDELSTILRYGVDNIGQEVSLAEDWRYTVEYLEIMRYRFGKRLSYESDIRVDMDEVCLPKLIFQPILENCIKYGEAEDGSVSIKLEAYEEDDALIVRIANAGRPITDEQLQIMRSFLQGEDNFTVHTGIYNLNRRLQLMYGEEYGLSIDCPKEGGTVVDLKLPLIKNKAE